MKNSLITASILWATLITNCFSQNVGWEVVQSNTGVNLNSIFFYDHQFGFACGDSGIVLKSVDSGKTWQSLLSPVEINLNDCYMRAQDCFLSVGDSAFIISTYDDGSSWYVNPHFLELDNDLYSVSMSKEQEGASSVFVGSSQLILFGVSTFCTGVIVDSSTRSSGGFWSSQMLTDVLGFIAGENSISQPIVGRTADGGSSWDYISFYLDGNEARATSVAFTDSLIGYISALVWDGRGAISKTTDNGDNWTTKFFSHPLHSISFPISGTSQVGYCIGDSGAILKTSNAGENWYNQISPTSERLNKVNFVDQNFGFAVGDNGTILRTTDGGVTHVDDDKNNDLPTEFLLYQNYPNPFNPTTTLSFAIGQSSFVSLKIFDVLGNEIATLVNEDKPVGSYEVEFDAAKLASGVYFYTLISNKFMATKKLVLLK